MASATQTEAPEDEPQKAKGAPAPEFDAKGAAAWHIAKTAGIYALKVAAVTAVVFATLSVIPAAIPYGVGWLIGSKAAAGFGTALFLKALATGGLVGGIVGGVLGVANGVGSAEEAVEEQQQTAAIRAERAHNQSINKEVLAMNLEQARERHRLAMQQKFSGESPEPGLAGAPGKPRDQLISNSYGVGN